MDRDSRLKQMEYLRHKIKTVPMRLCIKDTVLSERVLKYCCSIRDGCFAIAMAMHKGKNENK